MIPNIRIVFILTIATAVVSELVGCSDSDTKTISPSLPAASAAKPVPQPMSNSVIKPNPVEKIKSTTTVHKVIYKEGEYPTQPSWMTQKQWNSYIDWESNRQTKRETPRWDEDAKLMKVLRGKFGSRLREASTMKGSDQNDPVSGWVAEVDIYSNRNEADADMYVSQASETIFAANLNVNRVIVNICLHEEPIDATIYTVQIDKGQEPKTIAEFDPSG